MPASIQSTLDGSLTREEWQHIDGIEQLSRDPTDEEVKWGITLPELERRHQSSPEPTKVHERQCSECGCRVTERPDGTEAGHMSGWRTENSACSQHSAAGIKQSEL